MTVVSDVVAAGRKGDHYGAKLECPSTHVGLMTAAATWRSGREFLGLLHSHRNYSSSIVLQRDGGGGDEGGRVRVTADGVTPRVDYRIGAADRESMLDAGTLIARGGQRQHQVSSIWRATCGRRRSRQ